MLNEPSEREKIILLLEKDLFVEWLYSKQPDALVGFRRQKICCPVANYLGEKGVLSPEVDNWKVWVTTVFGDEQYAELPELFRQIVFKVDMDTNESTITAKGVLDIVNSAPQTVIPELR